MRPIVVVALAAGLSLGSAVAGAQARELAPLKPQQKALISGTWGLVGESRDDVSPDAALAARTLRCGAPMFSGEPADAPERAMRAVFPKPELARADLALFDDGRGLVWAERIDGRPRLTRVEAAVSQEPGQESVLNVLSISDWSPGGWTTAKPQLFAQALLRARRGSETPLLVLYVTRGDTKTRAYVKC